MFGWEKNMTTKISETREEELVWIWRRQVLDLLNGTLKYGFLLLVIQLLMHTSFLIPVATMVATYAT